jgi:hypothetical protein
MRYKTYILLLIAGIAFGIGIGRYSASGRLSLHSNYSYRNCVSKALDTPSSIQKQDFEKRYDSYTEKDKNIIAEHTQKALSGVGSKADELQKVAVINDYIYQYLIMKNNLGGCPKLLSDGYAICGGDVVCMAEMLYRIGIKSKFAYLLGVPKQGAHSLLEVYFKNGDEGLFDPTFGVFWYDERKRRTIPMLELIENPSLVRTTLFKSKHQKRKNTLETVKISKGYLASYGQQPYYSKDTNDYYLIFSQRTGGGIANEGMSTFVKVTLEPGVVLGKNSWKPADGGKPWSALSLLQDKNKHYISWAYMIGQTMGYDIKHIYRLNHLQPNTRYKLILYYSRAYNNTILSIQFINSQLPTFYKKVQNVEFYPARYKSSMLKIDFTAQASDDDVLIDAKGIMIINAMELSEIDQD